MDSFNSNLQQNNRKVPEVSSLIRTIQEVLEDNPNIIFAYLYGSIVESDHFKDVDIALYAIQGGAGSLRLEAEVQIKLSEKSGLSPDFFDVRVINKAPVSFAIRVLTKGKHLLSRDEELRSDYIERISSTYRKDFRIFEAT